MTTIPRRQEPDDERSGHSSLGNQSEWRTCVDSVRLWHYLRSAPDVQLQSSFRRHADPMIAKTRRLSLTLWFIIMLAPLAHADPLPYPSTPKNPVSETYHGVSVVDPYRWLENDGAPEVKQWAAAQNAFTRRYLDAIPQRPAIAKRVAELL